MLNKVCPKFLQLIPVHTLQTCCLNLEIVLRLRWKIISLHCLLIWKEKLCCTTWWSALLRSTVNGLSCYSWQSVLPRGSTVFLVQNSAGLSMKSAKRGTDDSVSNRESEIQIWWFLHMFEYQADPISYAWTTNEMQTVSWKHKPCLHSFGRQPSFGCTANIELMMTPLDRGTATRCTCNSGEPLPKISRKCRTVIYRNVMKIEYIYIYIIYI